MFSQWQSGLHVTQDLNSAILPPSPSLFNWVLPLDTAFYTSSQSCLSLKPACFIEPTYKSVIFGSGDTGSPDLLSPPKSFSSSLSVTLYFGPPELDFWYSTLALGYLHYM